VDGFSLGCNGLSHDIPHKDILGPGAQSICRRASTHDAFSATSPQRAIDPIGVGYATNYGEYLFHALGRIKGREKAGAL